MAENKGFASLLLVALAAVVALVAFRKPETIQQQMASIAPYLVDVWVRRNGVPLVYSPANPWANTLDYIRPGEAAGIQVTQAVRLTYKGNSWDLPAGYTEIVWR